MIAAIETRYGGALYRSRAEARWAVFFDLAGIPFQYEAEGFALGSGAYLPDFWLPAFGAFLEIKGVEPSLVERRKCAELAVARECDALLAVGAPDERFGLRWFDRDGERPGLYVLAQDRLAACGFWLISDNDEARHLGPNLTTDRPRGPMFSGVIEQAYEGARSVRFERGQARRRFEALAHEPERLAG